MKEYAHPESLSSTQWLAGHLDDPQLRVVEVVWGASPLWGMPVYEAGHIPGAVAWDFQAVLQDPARGDLIDTAGVEALLSRAGIDQDTWIVLYSGLNNLLATFVFWLLKIYGHSSVRLLDGGRSKWLDEGRSTISEAPVGAPRDSIGTLPSRYHAGEPDWSLRADRDAVLQVLGSGTHSLVDARSVEMYSGVDKAGAARGGHIPGAVNLAARRELRSDGSVIGWRVPTVQEDGAFRPAEELQELFDGLGVVRGKPVITYCVRGGLSTHAWFVLTQLLGYDDVREYDRSWAEWGSVEGLPIEP
jgi:thiosulfate/3-mercaptopyruvate sulfurtransferase